MQAWRPRIDELVEEMLGATHGDRLDVVASLASPLPVRVIAELLGADAERAADFRAWADASTRAASGSARGGFDEEAMVAVLAMAEHPGHEIEERQRAPRDDLLDRKRVVEGKRVSVRVDLGGRRRIQKK